MTSAKKDRVKECFERLASKLKIADEALVKEIPYITQCSPYERLQLAARLVAVDEHSDDMEAIGHEIHNIVPSWTDRS